MVITVSPAPKHWHRSQQWSHCPAQSPESCLAGRNIPPYHREPSGLYFPLPHRYSHFLCSFHSLGFYFAGIYCRRGSTHFQTPVLPQDPPRSVHLKIEEGISSKLASLMPDMILMIIKLTEGPTYILQFCRPCAALKVFIPIYRKRPRYWWQAW